MTTSGARGDLSGHTHFFRGGAELSAAAALLAERAAQGRAARALCAGCSVGAEPYSLAILCAERGVLVSIDATDVNEEALAEARAGRFDERVMWHTPPEMMAAYFERDGDAYVVAPSVRRRVTFERHDLLMEAGLAGAYDVILCRNVLIYYAPEAAARIVERLARALAPGGVLIVGATDTLAMRAATSVQPAGIEGIASYVRAGDGRTRAAPRPTEVDGAPPSKRRVVSGTLAELLAAACAHIAAHAWDEAEALLARAETADPSSAEPALYLGLVRRKQGRHQEAVKHLRRAALLAPESWVASYLLAGVWERLGEPDRAAAELARTAAALSRTDVAPLPDHAATAGLLLDPAEVARVCRERLARCATRGGSS